MNIPVALGKASSAQLQSTAEQSIAEDAIAARASTKTAGKTPRRDSSRCPWKAKHPRPMASSPSIEAYKYHGA